MKSLSLKGTGVALITPFRNGKINYPAFAEITERALIGEIDFLVPLGSTGEASALTAQEKRQLLKVCIQVNAGRKPIVAGLGGNDTHSMCQHLQSFDYSGADVIMISNPAYNKPTQEGLYAHFMRLAEASPLPILIYNIPGRTCSNLLPQTVLRLAKAGKEKFSGIKEASGNLLQIMQILAQKPENFSVLSGDDMLSLPLIACGADGVISVMANALPGRFASMVRLAREGRFDQARQIHNTLLPLNELLYREGNPAGIKAALEALGLCTRDLRLPLTPASEMLYLQIEKAVLQLVKNR
ncbi:MAG TPA: 4-hydroxy-tetrahydrodipicolinate synthase [Phaeodactylibacter sp.]|nr:4-hydroxy-tetrahydrodipicolinate synthase [Phaeodactylibacter sp.]